MTNHTDDGMTTNEPVVLVTEVNGADMMSCDALSLLFGLPAHDISDYIKNNVINDMTAFPAEWLKAGKRRVKEASAATGTNQLLDVLGYWADRDRNAEIVLIDGDERVSVVVDTLGGDDHD